MPITVSPAVTPSSKKLAARSNAPASSELGATAFPAALERVRRRDAAAPDKPEKPAAPDKPKSSRAANGKKGDKLDDAESLAATGETEAKQKSAKPADEATAAEESAPLDEAAEGEQIGETEEGDPAADDQPAEATAAAGGLVTPAATPDPDAADAEATGETAGEAEDAIIGVATEGAVDADGEAMVAAAALAEGGGGTSGEAAGDAGAGAGDDGSAPRDHSRHAALNVTFADGRSSEGTTPDAGADDASDAPSARPTPALAGAVAAAESLAGAVEPDAATPTQPQVAGGAADAMGSKVSAFNELLGAQATQPSGATAAQASDGPVAAPALPPELRFSGTNHANIVSGMRAELMPNGGTMRIRLDPPHLGALQVTVQMRDGVMTASFETSNDDATRLLSHSLTQLKSTLESQGVNVERLQVQQAPRDVQAQAPRDDQQQQQRDGQQGQSARQEQQEQQRREMMRRMWRRLNGRDPLDVTG